MKIRFVVVLAFILLAIQVSSAYNTHSAKQLGLLSKIAYEAVDTINGWKCSICSSIAFKNPSAFLNTQGGDIQGFTGYSSALNAIVIAFRGSVDIKNWIVNLNAIRVSYPKCSGCQVHQGFYNAYNSVSSTVKRNVANLKALYNSAPIYVTGHSLGGALALLAANDLRDTYSIGNVYTFGQPRIGNQQFASNFASRVPNTYRLIDYADLVPHVPPSAAGFLHSSSQIWYQKGMTSYKVCGAEDPTCSNSLAPGYNTDDHNLDNYLKLAGIQIWNSDIRINLQKQQIQ